MATFSVLLALGAGNSSVAGEFTTQRPVTQSCDVFFDLRLNTRLSKQWWGWYLRCHHNHHDVTVMSSQHTRESNHDIQFSCAITQPLLAHHWRVYQYLLMSRFTAPLIPWRASAPGGKMRKQLRKDHNFLNNSPIFIIESSTLIYWLFKKHCIQYISIWKFILDLVKGTWHHNFMAGCGSLLWANTCSLWSGIKSWPGAGCLQRQVRRSWQ